MTVLYAIGTVLRVILRIAPLPVQAVLTLLMLAIGFIGGLTNLVCWVLGVFFVMVVSVHLLMDLHLLDGKDSLWVSLLQWFLRP